MISVGNRDGRKGLGLELEMDETELEEGEALGYNDRDDEDDSAAIDPDIALSYIEEKIQNVLGHFQKDFEGGVSAENLGAKFGGYGSFLPTYQRSPPWSHAKSQQDGHNDSLRSPRKLHLEERRQSSLTSSSASPSARPSDAAGRTLAVGNSTKGNAYLLSRYAEESDSKCGVPVKSINPSDQKTLKVRLKVGSENLSTRKNAEIYSGLGLVVSPSSSLDDSPATSEGLCGKVLDAPEESPSSILEIMTSFPRGLLLSPLQEHLICLSETRKPWVKIESEPDDKRGLENLASVSNGFHSNRNNQKVLEHRKLKSSEKPDAFSSKPSNRKSDIDLKDTSSRVKKEKEANIDALGYEELVSNALKLPLLSSSRNTIEEPAYRLPTPTVHAAAPKDEAKGESFPGVTEKGHLSGESHQDGGIGEKLVGRMGSSGQFPESKKGNNFGDVVAYSQKDAHKAEISRSSDHYGSNISKGRRGLGAESTDPLKQGVVQKGGPDSEEGLNPAPENSSTAAQKRGSTVQCATTAENQLSVDYSVTSKRDKSTNGNGIFSKIDSRDIQKDHGKPGDRYKAFFGDVEFEDDDDESNSEEMTPSRKLKESQEVGKMSLDDHNIPNVKFNFRSSENMRGPGKNPGVTGQAAAPPGNGQSSEPPTQQMEKWVQCEKCEKWRLRPFGRDADELPDIWTCRMLNWLDRMNFCNIPEEVTTNATRAFYHPAVSVPIGTSENRQDVPGNSVPASVGVATVDATNGQVHQKVAGQTVKISRKKHGSTSATYSTDVDGSTHSSNSRKKNLLPSSGKSNKLKRGSRSPVLDASGYLQTRHTNSDIDKSHDNRKNGKVSLVNSSDKGNNLKIRNKRESDDIGGSRVSKRMKTEELRNDENWASDNGEAFPKAGRGHTTGLANNISSDGRLKYTNHKESGGDAKKNPLSVVDPEIHAPGTSGGVFLHSGKSDDKKRKSKESRGSQVHAEPLSSAGRRHRDSGDSVEMVYENGRQKGKKARVSESGEKDTTGSKANVGAEKKGGGSKEQQRGQSMNNSLIPDYSKCDMGSVQHSAAANSSSSKISGSHKIKTSTEDVKGSPVESVSSSPLRLPDRNPDKVTSARNLVEKDDFHDSGPLMGSSRKLGGEDNGRNTRAGIGKKESILPGNNHGADVYNDQLLENNQYASEKHSSEQCQVEEIINTQKPQNSGSHSKKSGKGSSSHSKDRGHAVASDIITDKTKGSDKSRGPSDHIRSSDEKPNSRRTKLDDRSGTPNRTDKLTAKKDTAEGTLAENIKGQRQKESGGHDIQDATKSQVKKHSLDKELAPEKIAKKNNQAEVLGTKKSHSLPPLARSQGETIASLQPDPGSQKQNGIKVSVVNALDNGDASKMPNQIKKAENQNGQSNTVRQSTSNVHKVRDTEAPSPLRRNSSSHAANSALKEAKDFKHLADRLKNNGSTDSTGYYFQAVLKFLHGASLLESGISEGTKQNDIAHATHIYKTTAKLCEYCAYEYEKSKDMANAALAYKCTEVAYLRVVYSSYTGATRDRSELQAALQVVPPGESPSSSASDIDNLNHQAIADKGPLAKVIGSPQVSGSHIISSRARAGLLRVMDFAQEVTNSMEATRKSRIAYAAATSRLGETTAHREGISSLKKALDFSFEDVDGLLRVVRVAVEALAR